MVAGRRAGVWRWLAPVLAGLVATLAPIAYRCYEDNRTEPPGRIVIEQRVVGGGGGGVTIDKTVTVRSNR